MSYLANILEQPEVLGVLLETYEGSSLWQDLKSKITTQQYQRVILTGMGSSYYSLFPTWLALNRQGISAIHIEASELVHYALEMVDAQTLLIVVSQSGESIEIQRLVEAVKGKTTLVSITNTETNFLAAQSHFPLTTRAGIEVPVATKTYTGGLLLLHLLCQALTGQLQPQMYLELRQVVDQMATLLDRWSVWIDPAVDALQSASFLTLLGRGPAVASAMTGALILKEAVRLNAAGLSGGQFRHGPMEAVSPALGAIIFANQGPTTEISQRLAQDIRDRGGQVVLVGKADPNFQGVHLALPPVNESLSPILEIVAVQLLAARLAEQAGLVPGEFRWSGKVIRAE